MGSMAVTFSHFVPTLTETYIDQKIVPQFLIPQRKRKPNFFLSPVSNVIIVIICAMNFFLVYWCPLLYHFLCATLYNTWILIATLSEKLMHKRGHRIPREGGRGHLT